MATIYKRRNSFYLQWHDKAKGQQYRKSLGQVSKAQAEVRRKAKEVELATGKNVFGSSDLFGVAAVEYLDWHEHAFPDSHPRVRFIVEHRLTDFHDTPLHELEQADIERWIARRGREVAAETVTKELRTLKAVLNKCIAWGLLDKSPARYVSSPKSDDDAPMRWYTADELQRVYADPLHGAVWRLMACTGLRRAEANNLRWSDVKADELHVVSRKGARTKSKRFRVVPLSNGAQTALQTLEEKTGDSDYVLPRMTIQSWTRAFARAAREANLDGSLHSLRHSFCANLVSGGVNLRVVQELAGHADYKTTLKYAHVAPAALREAIGALQAL